MNALLQVFYVLGGILLAVGTLTLAYYPLALLSALRKRGQPVFCTDPPRVSIIVPAYNEEKVIENCIRSILNTGYPDLELILVDDGSKDGTLEIMMQYEDQPRVCVVPQRNRGKAAALNNGLRAAGGEIIFFVDADGIFTRNTIPQMLEQFSSPKVGGVCGNDAPVNLDKLQTRLMCLQTHVGTAFVRRALAEINCLPIISGNIGAFRRSALEAAARGKSRPADCALDDWPHCSPGPFREGFIGEDLELTWRIHRAGYQVKFAAQAIVLAEAPSTLKGLWKQRVRWARGFLQTVRLHKDLFFNLKHGPLGLYLPLNFFNQAVNPILQLALLAVLLALTALGHNPLSPNLLALVLWLGLGTAMFSTLFAISLDRAWKDLRYLYILPLWVPYSIFMDLVMVWAIVLELRGSSASWNKLERTGVVSRKEM